MENGGKVLDLNLRLLLVVKACPVVYRLRFKHDKGVLSGFALDTVHILREFGKRVVRERSALYKYHQRRMPAVLEIVVIQIFGSAASVYAEYLSYPTHLAVWRCADCKLHNLVCLIIEVNGPAISDILSVALIHNTRVAEFLKIDRLAVNVLAILPKFPLSGDFLALIEKGRINIRL